MRKIGAAFIILVLIVLASALPAAAQQNDGTGSGSGGTTGGTTGGAQTQQQQQQVPLTVAPQIYDSARAALEAVDLDRAILDSSLYILLNPTDNRAYLLRAVTHLQRQDLDSALDDLNQAISVTMDEPNFAATLYYIRGNVYGQQDRPDDAIADYTESLTLNPTADAYSGRALVYARQENFSLALDDVNNAITLNSDNPVFLYYRASFNASLENALESATDFLGFFNMIESERVDEEALIAGSPVIYAMDFGRVYAVPFEAESGQRLSILAVGRPGAQIDPLLVLTDADGNPLIADDDSADGVGALILDFVIPRDATYTLLIGHGLGGFEGDIAVGIELIDPAAD